MIRSMLFRDKKGFTLVELVVIVAILAILAGIAVPVYSGYIEKAHEAADLQLLDAMNTAFAAACAARGIDPRSLSGEDVLVTPESGRNAVGGIAVLRDHTLSDALNSDFLAFFGENTETEFQTYEVEDITLQGGVFTHNGTAFSNRWSNSNFSGNAVQLLSSLDNISGAISKSSTLNRILQMLEENPDAYPELKAAFGDFPQAVQVYNIDNPARGNIAILFIAQDSSKVSTDKAYQSVSTVINDLKTVDVAEEDLNSMINVLSSWGGDTTAMTKVSLACAVATGFYNSDYSDSSADGSDDKPTYFNGSSLSAALKYIQGAARDPKFQAYLENEGRADVSAYLAAMSLLERNKATIQENINNAKVFINMQQELLEQLGVNT